MTDRSLIYTSCMANVAAADINFGTDTFYLMLVDNTYTPDRANHSKRSDITGEIVASGYTAGGMAATVTPTTVNNRVDVTITDVVWNPITLSGAWGAVLYKHRGGLASADELICFLDFQAAQSDTAGVFTVHFTNPLIFTVVSGLTDAPSDGNQYARKNAAWDIVASGGGAQIPAINNPSPAAFTTTSGTPVSISAIADYGFEIVCQPFGTTSLDGYMQAAPGTPWTATFGLSFAPQPGQFGGAGIILGDSSGKRIAFYGQGQVITSNSSPGYGIAHWNSATSFNSVLYQGYSTIHNYFRVQDDGTNVIFSVSRDNIHYTPLYSESRTAFFSAGPTFVGLSFNPQGVTAPGGVDAKLLCFYFSF